MCKSREKVFITKEHIAKHAHLNFKFKAALYTSTLVVTQQYKVVLS